MDLPFPTEYLVPIGLALFVLLVGGGLLARLLGSRLRRVNTTEAELDTIAPHFDERNLSRTQWMRCGYHFIAGGRTHSGRCLLPLAHFVKNVLPPGAVVIHDVRIDMPILISETDRIIGEEAIEHHLISAVSKVRVRYQVRNPDRNQAVEAGALQKDKIRSI